MSVPSIFVTEEGTGQTSEDEESAEDAKSWIKYGVQADLGWGRS
jgi:hypothetical protein